MKKEQEFDYNGQLIAFDPKGKDVMVNATHMAKAHGKDVREFQKNEATKQFIEVLLAHLNQKDNEGNSPHYTVDDVLVTNKKGGTYMHRILALKFAAWLDPKFELWVYSTIEGILFGSYREMEAGLRASAERTRKLKELETRLRNHPDYTELERLRQEERQAKYGRQRIISNQLRLFLDEDGE